MSVFSRKGIGASLWLSIRLCHGTFTSWMGDAAILVGFSSACGCYLLLAYSCPTLGDRFILPKNVESLYSVLSICPCSSDAQALM